MSNFGKRIKNIRVNADMTQQEFADFLKLKNKQTVSDVERGTQKSLKDYQIETILDTFGINKTWLLLGEGNMNVQMADESNTGNDKPSNEFENLIIGVYKKASLRKKQELIKMALSIQEEEDIKIPE